MIERMQQNPTYGQKVEAGCPKGEWLPMGGRRGHPLNHLDRREFVVTFEEPGDCWNPQNWTSWKKLTCLLEIDMQRADT